MEVYLVRHSAALDVGEDGITRDFDRPLSKDGRRKSDEVAAGLQALGVQPEQVCASPLVRAQETARLLGAVLCPDVPVKVCESLQPGSSLEETVATLRRQAGDRILAVGHLPDIAQLASYLLTGKPGLNVEFKKAAVCCISFEGTPVAGKGQLVWHMQPGQIRAIRV